MKSKSITLSLFIIVFTLFLFTSCGDKKADSAPAVQEESSVSHDEDAHSEHKEDATAEYQCPMDCEDGKTYKEAGSCPVCKMDLKAQNDTQASSTCKKGEEGKCACDEDECKCKNCPNRA